MKALVTGAGGFIGSHICRALLEKDDKVRGLFLPGEEAGDLEVEGVEVARGDITRPPTLKGCTRDCDVVYHCAARVLDWGPRRLFTETIVDGTRNLLDESLGQVKRFVYLSSIAAYGLKYHNKDCTEDAPLRRVGIPYGDCKAEAEEICRSYHNKEGLEVTIIRPSNVFGPTSVWVRDVLDAFQRGHIFELRTDAYGAVPVDVLVLGPGTYGISPAATLLSGVAPSGQPSLVATCAPGAE